MFIWGVLASVVGNIIIGCGQTIQKYGLNKLHKNESRLTSMPWILGITLAYLGEAGNMIGITFASPSIVTPLGIISVFANAILASVFLKESLGGSKSGYYWIIAGVVLIMIVAPKPSTGDLVGLEAVTSLEMWTGFFQSSLFVPMVLFLYSVGSVGGYHIIVNAGNKAPMPAYVVCGSTFGSISIMAGKLLTHLSRVEYPDKYDMPIFQIIVLVVMLVSAVGGQEFMKQMALSQFPVSKLQPQYYAVYNILVVLTSAIVFQEINGGIQAWMIFFSLFATGILLIVQGSIQLQQGDQSQTKSKRVV